ncbi:MAG: ABC transporter permease [Thermodesulfobacteriota bacterium]|nr:ABC transporter permease [Thermodesulfobacteriota bacterium]
MTWKRMRMHNVTNVVLGLAVIIGIWEYGTGFAGIAEYILPVPSVIVLKFWHTFFIQVHHLSFTAATTVAGLILSLFVGVLLALCVIYIKPVKAITLPVLAAFNSIPKIAIAPLFVIWFGLGVESKVLLAFLLGLFPVFVNSATGLGEIEPDILDLAKLTGGTELRIFRKVRLMNAVPYIIDALKVAFPLALVGSIVGEFIGGNRGIGYLILSAQFNLDAPLVFACLMSISLFSTLAIGVVVLLERILLKWRPSRRKR